MSGKSCTSGSGGGGSVRLGSVRIPAASGGGASHEVVLDALYDRKRDKKTVRVLTVIVYVFCVSLAAIMLSLYYVFFWEPKDAQRKVAHTVDQQTSTTPMPTCFMPHTGGGDTSMSEATSSTPNIDSPEPSASDPSPSPLSTSLTPTASSEFNLTWFSDNYTTTDGPT